MPDVRALTDEDLLSFGTEDVGGIDISKLFLTKDEEVRRAEARKLKQESEKQAEEQARKAAEFMAQGLSADIEAAAERGARSAMPNLERGVFIPADAAAGEQAPIEGNSPAKKAISKAGEALKRILYVIAILAGSLLLSAVFSLILNMAANDSLTFSEALQGLADWIRAAWATISGFFSSLFQ